MQGPTDTLGDALDDLEVEECQTDAILYNGFVNTIALSGRLGSRTLEVPLTLNRVESWTNAQFLDACPGLIVRNYAMLTPFDKRPRKTAKLVHFFPRGRRVAPLGKTVVVHGDDRTTSDGARLKAVPERGTVTIARRLTAADVAAGRVCVLETTVSEPRIQIPHIDPRGPSYSIPGPMVTEYAQQTICMTPRRLRR
jgi:hypothetical protein